MVQASPRRHGGAAGPSPGAHHGPGLLGGGGGAADWHRAPRVLLGHLGRLVARLSVRERLYGLLGLVLLSMSLLAVNDRSREEVHARERSALATRESRLPGAREPPPMHDDLSLWARPTTRQEVWAAGTEGTDAGLGQHLRALLEPAELDEARSLCGR